MLTMEFLQICTALLAVFVYIDWTMASEQQPCPKINLKNGRVRERSKGRLASFRCRKNFELVGVKFAICLDSGQWSQQIPVCVGTTCHTPDDVPNLIVDKLYKGGVLKFTCEAGLTRSGPEKIMCDGNKWSEQPPTCKKDLSMGCDFEDQGLCGWSHDFEDDFDWMWNKGETPTAETGPRFDHTTNTSEGHYLYMEASAPQTSGKKTRIVSPAYEPKDNLCLEFFYHMFGPEGAGEVGDLDVYVKPSSLKTTMLDVSYNVFHSNGNHGDQWLRAEVNLPKQAGTFQIVFEGTRRKSWSGDIAIDDVKLRDCLQKTTNNAVPNNDNSDKDVDDDGNDPDPSSTEKTTLIGRPTTSKVPDSMTTRKVQTLTDEISVSSTQLTTTLQPSKVTKTPETTATLTSVPASVLIVSTTPGTPSTSKPTTIGVTSPPTTTTTTRPTTTPVTTTVVQTSSSTVTSTTTTTTTATTRPTIATTTIPTIAPTKPTTATTIPTTTTTIPTTATTIPTTAPTKPTTATQTPKTTITTIPATTTAPTTSIPTTVTTTTTTAQTIASTTTSAPTKSTTTFATSKSTSVTENCVEITVNKKPSPISRESTDPTTQVISSTNTTSNNEVTTTQIVPTKADKSYAQTVTDDHENETDRNNTDNYDYNYGGKSNNNEEDTDDDDDNTNSDGENSNDENSDKDNNTYEEKSDTSESDYSDINSKDETDSDPSFINVPERNDSQSEVDNSDQNNSEDIPTTTISAAKETLKSRISVDGNTPRTGHVKDSSPSTKELIPMIVGVAAAVLVTAVVISVLAWVWARNQRRKQEKDEEDQMNIITEYVETNLSI